MTIGNANCHAESRDLVFLPANTSLKVSLLSQAGVNAQTPGGLAESLIFRPQHRHRTHGLKYP
jgi:hypothetical protein